MAALWRSQIGGGAALWGASNGASFGGAETTPAAPTVVAGDGTGATTATVTWVNNSGGAHRVQIESPQGSNAWTDATGSTNPTATGVSSFSVTGLTGATNYGVRVRAEGPTLQSAYVVGTAFGTDNTGGGGGVIPTPGTVPSIVTQPVAQTVETGVSVTFVVAYTGAATITAQWLRNGDDIPGATADSYTFAAALTDGGASFSVRLTNTFGTVTSTSALLSVNSVGGTLIVEDGTARTNSDSYISLVAAGLYHANRGNTAWAGLSTLGKESALLKATSYMMQVYRWRWAGSRKTDTQALDWPRYDVPMQDAPSGYGSAASVYPDNAVPEAVQNACAELALRASTGDLAPDVGRVTARERIDVIEVEYTAGAAPWVRYRAVDNMLTAFFKPSAGSVITLTRG